MKYNYKNLDRLTPQEIMLLCRLDEDSMVSFSFWKKGENGEGMVRRDAKGTRNQTYIPIDKWAKHPTDDLSKKINFYDLEKQDWRGMSIGKLIAIN